MQVACWAHSIQPCPSTYPLSVGRAARTLHRVSTVPAGVHFACYLPYPATAALGYNRAYHYVDVFGADGKRIGRVRYGYCFRRPLDGLLKEYKLQASNGGTNAK